MRKWIFLFLSLILAGILAGGAFASASGTADARKAGGEAGLATEADTQNTEREDLMPDPAAKVQELKEDYEERFLNPDIARDRGYIDEVILPEETRERLIRSFDFLSEKQPLSDHSDSWRRHGNIPL